MTYAGGGTISTVLTKTRGRFIIHSYFQPPAKDNMLWRNTGHSFSKLIFRLNSTSIRKHLLASKDIRTILAATHKLVPRLNQGVPVKLVSCADGMVEEKQVCEEAKSIG